MVATELILLLLEKCKDFVRCDIFHGKPAFESQARVVEQLVECITVRLKFARGIFHGHILYAVQDLRLTLPVRTSLGVISSLESRRLSRRRASWSSL